MSGREAIELQGFNNLSKCLSFNLYDFAVARNEDERRSYLAYLHEHFGGRRITGQKARPPHFPMGRGVIRKDQWPWQDRRTLSPLCMI